MHCHPVLTQEQRRFEYNSLDKINNFSKEFNCFADAIPDLSLSLQMDWTTGLVKDFDHYLTVIRDKIK
jgi:hypothetical protein